MKIYPEKDPSFKTLLLQEALAARGLYKGNLDNWPGPATEDALEAAQEAISGTLTPPPSAPPADGPPNRWRDISARGIELIKHFEGLFLTAYLCPAGVWTIGYGHTGLRHRDGTVRAGRKITEAEAETLLRIDMDYFEGKVQSLVKVPLNDDQFAALVSFAFNVGEGNLASSTLLRRLNAGDYAGAAEQFARWNKAAGKTLAGLTRRRSSERNLFLGKTPFIVK